VPLKARPSSSASAPPLRASRQAPGSFYRQHLFAARHFADLASALEEQQPTQPDPQARQRHRAYVMGAILAAAAFLEASINELYEELQESSENGRPGTARRALSIPTRLWSAMAPPPILHKYQLALLVADAEPFDERRAPFRDVDGLLALRDALLHGRAEWRDATGRRQSLERRLRAKFEHNALASVEDAAFPDHLLGGGCAAWAVLVVEGFSDDFCRRMTIPARGVA